jgi:cytidylate kinase
LLQSDAPSAAPFITISREPGAGAIDVGRLCVEALNADCTDDDHKWTYWDRELVEKVAADHHLSERLVEGLEERNHSWMTQFLSSLSFTDTGPSHDEDLIYGRVKRTIESLSVAGRAIIIGRGGVFITHHLPGGIHIRLVAPFRDRVSAMVSRLGLSERTVVHDIHEIEKNRRTFFKMHWPNQTLDPENFTLTINAAQVEIPAIVQMVQALVRQKVAASR